MIDAADVARALRSIVPTSHFCGASAIRHAPIHPDEACLYTGVVPRVRDATATGRLLAREVLRSMGVSPGPILRNAGGAPAFPIGVCGSIAHDDEFAVCVAGAGVGSAIGVDIEAPVALPAEIVDDVCCSDVERRHAAADPLGGTLLFAAKEAVYKACFPVEQVFYEFADVFLCSGFFAADAGQLAPREPRRYGFKTSTGTYCSVTMTRHPRVLTVAHRVSFAGLYAR